MQFCNSRLGICLIFEKNNMKKLILLLVIASTSLLQPASAQENASNNVKALTGYYNIKDALVSGNAALAHSKATELVEILTTESSLPEARRIALIKDAAGMANTQDINKQRAYFSDLSENIFKLAKGQKLSTEPIYKAYCPMAKASWLSNSSAIKNPYYGSAMLTCGSVVETIK
jgi:hypothetical protein